MNVSKRNFLTILTIPSFLYLSKFPAFGKALSQPSNNEPSLTQLDDEYLVVNGWVMLKTDLEG